MIPLLLALQAAAQQPPKIDYKLQFEMRTAEMELQAAQQQLDAVRAKMQAKAAELRKICGTYVLGIDQQTTEYVCKPPEAQKK